MKFTQVNLDSIVYTVRRETYTNTEIQKLAQAIIDNGGLIRPLVLVEAGVGTYEVVDNFLGFWAAKEAQKTSEIGSVNAVIIPRSAKQQIGLLNQEEIVHDIFHINELS